MEKTKTIIKKLKISNASLAVILKEKRLLNSCYEKHITLNKILNVVYDF